MEIRIIFTFNGMFILCIETFCPRNLMVEIKILKTDAVFPQFLLRFQKDMHVI